MSKERRGEQRREEGGRVGLERKREEGWKKKRKSDETERTLSMGFLGGYIQEIRPMATPFLQTHTHTHSLAQMLALKRGVAWGTEKVFEKGKCIHQLHQNRNFLYEGTASWITARAYTGAKTTPEKKEKKK